MLLPGYVGPSLQINDGYMDAIRGERTRHRGTTLYWLSYDTRDLVKTG